MIHVPNTRLLSGFLARKDKEACFAFCPCFLFSFYHTMFCVCVSFVPCRAITLDNQLVLLATTAADAGRYHAEAVNEMTGENVTSAAVYLSVSG